MRRRPPRRSRAGGCTPGTSPCGTRATTSRSRTARRTSSFPAARTFPRWKSRSRSTSILPLSWPPWWRGPTRNGARRPARSCNSSRAPARPRLNTSNGAGRTWPASRSRRKLSSARCRPRRPAKSRSLFCGKERNRFSVLSIEALVLVGGGVRDRLDVRVDRGVRHHRAHAGFDLFAQPVCLRDGPGVGDKNVKRHEAARARLAGAQRVERDAVAARVFGEQLGDLVLLVAGNRRVEQPRNRAPHQADAGPDDVRRHGERDERVEQQPPGGEYQRHARDHADRAPYVSHEMLAVRLQRDAVVAASRALQYQRRRKIDRRRCRADTQAKNGGLERLRVEEPW